MKNQAETIGELIRKARQEKKLTVRALAEALALSPGAVSNLENGKVQKIRPEHRQKLLEVLGVEISEESSPMDELDSVFEKLNIEPIQQELFRRALGNTVAKRRQGGNEMSEEQLTKKVRSVLPMVPSPTVLKMRSPEVAGALNALGLSPDESYRSDVERVLNDIESIIFKDIETGDDEGSLLSKQESLLFKVGTKYHVGVHVVKNTPEQTLELKQKLIAEGFLSMAMEVEEAEEDSKYFGAVAAGDTTQGSYDYCLLLSNTTQEKERRWLFTFAHELAHVCVDPNLKKGDPVHRYRGVAGNNPLEWFVDQVAGRILFPSFWMRPKVLDFAFRNGHPILASTDVTFFRTLYAPSASYQAVVNALVNYWPIPILYVEAYKRNFRIPGNSSQVVTSPLTVYYTSRNKAATEINLTIPYRCFVPKESSLHAFYDRLSDPQMGNASENFSGEDLSIWQKGMPTISNGTKLFLTCCRTKRDDDTVVVKAFLMPYAKIMEPVVSDPN